jgi:hypothetical protein
LLVRRHPQGVWCHSEGTITTRKTPRFQRCSTRLE